VEGNAPISPAVLSGELASTPTPAASVSAFVLHDALVKLLQTGDKGSAFPFRGGFVNTSCVHSALSSWPRGDIRSRASGLLGKKWGTAGSNIPSSLVFLG
ncbi:unnamed protein product, partial [Phaeothamnion confervicola]